MPPILRLFRMKVLAEENLQAYFAANAPENNPDKWAVYTADITSRRGIPSGHQFGTVFKHEPGSRSHGAIELFKISKDFEFIKFYWYNNIMGKPYNLVEKRFPKLHLVSGKDVIIVRLMIPGIFRCIIRLICLLKRKRSHIARRKLFLLATHRNSTSPLQKIGSTLFSITKKKIYEFI